ncbi:MAG: DMT family transporter [Aestuariivirgaceae bacterium]
MTSEVAWLSREKSQLSGILLKIASTLAFTCMIACLKAVADDIPAGQQVFFRSAFALVPTIIMVLTMRAQRLRRIFITTNFISHLWRGGVGALSMLAWFFAIAHLDLPAAMAIGFLSPLLVIMLAGIVLGEKLTATRIIAVLLGFVGILFILWPQLKLVEHLPLEAPKLTGAAAALASAFFAACAMILVRRLIKHESTTTIVVWFSINSALIGLATLPFGWVLPTGTELGLLVLSGLFGGVGQLLLTQSYRYADASTIAPFDYTQMIWVLIVAWFIFGEHPSVHVLIGATIVIAAGLMVILGEHRPRKGSRQIGR